MPTLTVTEKEHWKERITQRIKKKIAIIVAGEPQLFERLQREARQRAYSSLGLAELQRNKEDIERQKEALEERERAVERALLAAVRRVPVDTIDDYVCRYSHDVENAVSARADVHEEELLAESDFGRQVLGLRQEEANILDAVWLATSPKELKTLWEKVSGFLGEEHSQLIADALAIESP